jgi:hypothetical protein
VSTIGIHRRAYGAILSSLVLGLSTLGRADGPTAIVDAWEAPPECPTGAAIERQVREILVGSQLGPAGLTAQGTVTRASTDRWRVDLTLRSAGWEARRTLGGSTCEAVSQAAALVIALAVNLEARAPLAAKPVQPVAPPSAAPPMPVGPTAGLGMAFDFGSLPRGTVGLEGTFGWRIPHARIELGASYLLPRQGTVFGRSDVGATFHFASGNLRACYELAASSLVLGPCLDAGVTWTGANGFGSIAIDSVSSVGVTVGGDVAARWLISKHLAPYVRLGALAPLNRPDFAVRDVGTVYRATPGVLRGGVGIEAHFD